MREGSSSGNAQPLMLELVTQIFQQMKGLCNTVQNLMDQVKELSKTPPAQAHTSATADPAPTPAQPTRLSPSQDEYKATIRKEIQEMNEREKRRSSIIVKGLSASSPRDLAQKFSLLTEEIMGVAAPLSDVTPIPGHANIFRAKLLNDEIRKQVLDRSKSLRGTNYNQVYISRDLTYAQRAELFARRQARRAEPNGNNPHDAARPADAPAPNPGSDTAPAAPLSDQGNVNH